MGAPTALRSSLRKAGNLVLRASSQIEALKTLHAFPDVDLVVIDVGARDDGFDLVAALAEDPILRHVPVVVVATSMSPQHLQAAVGLGIALRSAVSPPRSVALPEA